MLLKGKTHPKLNPKELECGKVVYALPQLGILLRASMKIPLAKEARVDILAENYGVKIETINLALSAHTSSIETHVVSFFSCFLRFEFSATTGVLSIGT